MSGFFDLSVYLLGSLPDSLFFLYGVFAFILGIIFFFVVLSPFIWIWKWFNK